MGVPARADVDRLCELARADGRTVLGPVDSGPPVGYWAYLVDPDGHNLEISYGQEVGLTVEQIDLTRRVPEAARAGAIGP